jgi:hypothetical protein
MLPLPVVQCLDIDSISDAATPQYGTAPAARHPYAMQKLLQTTSSKHFFSHPVGADRICSRKTFWNWTRQINRMEREFLIGVKFDLYVEKSTYKPWLHPPRLGQGHGQKMIAPIVWCSACI